MRLKIKSVYLLIQTIVFAILALASLWVSIGNRYEALKKKVNYRKLYGVLFVATVLEGIETFVVLRLLNWKRR